MTPALGNFAFDPAAYAGTRVDAGGGVPAPFVPSWRIGTAVVTGSIATPQFRRFAASAGTAFGNDVDFLEASHVRRADYNASLDLRPSERLRVSATYVSTSFTRRSDGVRTLSTRIPRARVEYQLGRPIFVRLVMQYEASERLPLVDPSTGKVLLTRAPNGTFQPSTARRTNTLRGDALFSYRPSPGTVFFAGYGNTLTEPSPLAFDALRRTTDSFFVKVSYVFRTAGPR